MRQSNEWDERLEGTAVQNGTSEAAEKAAEELRRARALAPTHFQLLSAASTLKRRQDKTHVADLPERLQEEARVQDRRLCGHAGARSPSGVAAGGSPTIAQILQSVKQPFSVLVRKEPWFSHEIVWQPGGGHDRNIWSDEAIFSVIEYVHTNPVTRGLANSSEEYRWSSAAWYNDRTGPLEVDTWEP